MTDTTTLDERSDDELPELVESERLGAGGTAKDTPLEARVLLPFLIPLLSIAIVAVLVLDISRVFLAGDEDVALVMGIVLTVAILVGASLIAAAPRLRTASLVLILAGVFVFVSGAGLVSLGPSLDAGHGSSVAYVEPAGPAASTISVQAGPGLTFDGVAGTGVYRASAGVVEIDYGGATGHTLAIQDPRFDGFELTSDASGPNQGRVELAPGTYTIYCTVGDHEARGMKATLEIS